MVQRVYRRRPPLLQRKDGRWLFGLGLSLTALICITVMRQTECTESGEERVVAHTAQGPLIGKMLPTGVHAFLGIPYARPPVGSLRFEPPVPREPWGPQRREALEFGAECMQAGQPDRPLRLSEDCLFLNIWTPPGTKRGGNLPVMVWLYGGGFQHGASSHPEYIGDRLAERGVVVVSINYRLGALGWMVSVDDDLWGNYGLQDQRLALGWVHDNVRSFGGDPARVTLFGESAGAMSIGQHLHMDGAGTLFHQVIMQSNPLGYRFRSVTVANFLGQAVKRGLDCVDLACLQEEPAADILRVQESLMGVPRSVGDFFSWGPVMTDSNYQRHVAKHRKRFTSATGGFNYTAPFMTVVQPLEAMASRAAAATAASLSPYQLFPSATDMGATGAQEGRVRGLGPGVGGEEEAQPVPVLLGVNADEGLMFVHGAYPVAMAKLVYLSFVAVLFRTSVLRIVRVYSPMAKAVEEQGSGDYRPVMSQILHDYLFRCPTLRAAHLLKESYGNKAQVFVYEFSHPTDVPDFPECSGRSCHTAELPYVFQQDEVIKEMYSHHKIVTSSTSQSSSHTNGSEEGSVPDGHERSNVSENVALQEDGGRGGSKLAVLGRVWGGIRRAGRLGRSQGNDASVDDNCAEESNVPGGLGSLLLGEEISDVSEKGNSGEVVLKRSVEGVRGSGAVCEGSGMENECSGAGDEDSVVGGMGRDEIERGEAMVVESSLELAMEGGDNGSHVTGLAREKGGEIGTVGGEGFYDTMVETGASPTDQYISGKDMDPAGSSCLDVGDAHGHRCIQGAGAGSTGILEGDGDGSSRMGGVFGRKEEEGEIEGFCTGVAGTGSEEEQGREGRETALLSVREALARDLFVSDAMAGYWASFGKVGDPNHAAAPMLWPVWEGRRRLHAVDDGSSAAAIASILGTGGEGASDLTTLASGGLSAVGKSPRYLEIKAEPEVQEAKRDCICDFWDKLGYRH